MGRLIQEKIIDFRDIFLVMQNVEDKNELLALLTTEHLKNLLQDEWRFSYFVKCLNILTLTPKKIFDYLSTININELILKDDCYVGAGLSDILLLLLKNDRVALLNEISDEAFKKIFGLSECFKKCLQLLDENDRGKCIAKARPFSERNKMGATDYYIILKQIAPVVPDQQKDCFFSSDEEKEGVKFYVENPSCGLDEYAEALFPRLPLPS